VGFGKTGAQVKPNRVCIGTIGTIGPVVKSKKDGSPYFYEEIKIKKQADGVDNKVLLMWAPEWFQAKFADPKSFKGAMDEWCKANPRVVENEDGTTEEKDGSTFVFEKNISAKTKKDTSFLEGLSGSSEPWEEIQKALTNEDRQKTSDEVHEIIKDFLENLGPVPFLYVLKQQKQDGVLDDFYEVDEIRWLTEKNLKLYVNKAEYAAKAIASGKPKAGAPWKFTFDPTDFGFDVKLPADAEPAWVA